MAIALEVVLVRDVGAIEKFTWCFLSCPTVSFFYGYGCGCLYVYVCICICGCVCLHVKLNTKDI